MSKIAIVAAVAAAATLMLAGCAKDDQSMPASNASQAGYSSKLGTTHHRHAHKATVKAAPAAVPATAAATTASTTTSN